MSDEKYEVSVDKTKQEVHITFSGMLEPEDAEKFFVVYGNVTNGLPKEDYTVVVDCKNINIFKPEVIPYVRHGFIEYNNYKHIQVIESTGTLVKMQFRRIGKELILPEKRSVVKG